jgi:hypothetical protein
MWGPEQRHIHNQLSLISVYVNQAILMDASKPVRKSYIRGHKFEPRWFRIGIVGKNGDYCALEEWLDPENREKHQRRIVVFDCRTGKEVTGKLAKQLSDCSKLERLNPVLKEESR